MRKVFIFAASALALLTACNKKSEMVSPVHRGEECKLIVNVEGVSRTKAGVNALDDEEKVSSLQVFLFADGQIDSYGSVTDGSSSVTLKATAGVRNVYAVVNAPDLSTLATESALKTAVTRLSDNNTNKFVMVGSLSSESITNGVNIVVPVDRIAARIIVRKLTRKYDALALQQPGVEVKINRLYLTDVATDNTYSVSKTSAYSYANSVLGSTTLDPANAFLYHDLSGRVIAAHEDSYVFVDDTKREGVFYVYPNATSSDGATDRITRLNIEIEVDGELYNYPVLIPNIKANKSYEINELIVTRLGNPSNGDNNVDEGEGEEIKSFDIPFGITVNDWGVELLGESGVVTL